MTTADRVALVDRQGPMLEAELRARVDRARGALRRRGVAPGDAVLIVSANERSSVIAYHATVELGAIAVMSQVGAGATERRVACAATQPVLAVLSPPACDAELELPDGMPTVAAVDLDTDTTHTGASDSTDLAAADVDAPRLVVFTSGTTSTPKGVVHSARSIAAAVACFAAVTPLTDRDRFFVVSPIASMTGVLQALEYGPSVGAAPVLESAWDDDSLDLLLAGQATAYGGPDLVLDRLLATATRRGVDVPLRVASLGGTMLRRELIDTAEQDFGIKVVRVYGSSEAPCSSGTRVTEPDTTRLVDEGIPGPDVELRISERGELLIRGPHLFLGYVDAADDEGALVDGWFCTGDEAVLADGRLRIIGRFKDVVSRNGKKISLAEIDQSFTAVTGIAECAAFGVPDDRTGERVVMAVRLPDAVELDVPSVLGAMEGSGLARFKLPESIVAFDGPLPTTATGKVQRRALTEAGRVIWRADRLDVAPE